jgi:hypothetical protein
MIRNGIMLAAMLAAVLINPRLHAADEQIDRESLRSLDGVRVAVQDLPAGAPKELNKDALREFVESRLVAAHVPLLMPGEYPVGDPFLRVTVKTTAESAGVAGYHVDLEFVQIVFVRRNPMLTFNRAQTWAANAHMGLAARGQLTERVRKDLAEEVDQFIAAYKSVNSN